MKTEQCFCKSYSDDDHKIQDCTCGKCDTQEIQEWSEEFDNKLPISEWYCSDTKEVEELRETVKSFISQKLKEQRSEIMINLLLNSGLSLEEIKLLLKDSKNETK